MRSLRQKKIRLIREIRVQNTHAEPLTKIIRIIRAIRVQNTHAEPLTKKIRLIREIRVPKNKSIDRNGEVLYTRARATRHSDNAIYCHYYH